MPSNYDIGYNVDLVLCIDATGSMRNAIDMVKQNALRFYDDVERAMVAARKEITSLRLRVIAFRDYIADGDDAMLVTDFFKLPEEAPIFRDAVMGISAFGGGDDPEDGLEALAFAIRSNWTPASPDAKRRQVIVVWTDAPTHPIGFGAAAKGYPHGMPASFADLTQWWGGEGGSAYMDARAKRLLLYAPEEPFWTTISDNWRNVIHFVSAAGQGLNDHDYNEIIQTIVHTIG